LETYGGAYQPEERLKRVGDIPTQEELTKANLSEEEVEQQLDDETTELNSAADWKLDATKGDKDSMGDRVYMPIDKYGEKEVQQRRLHKKSQPLEQLDRVIEETRKMMLRSAETMAKRT
jgi:hypothetical protein